MEKNMRKSVYLLLVGLVIIVSLAQAVGEERHPKFAGAQFAADRTPTNTPRELSRPTMTTQTLLPELKVKVLVPAGETIKPTLGNVLRPGRRPAGRGPEQHVLKDVARETLRVAREASEVRTIELDRPKQSRPLVRVPFDPERRIPFNLDARRSHFVPEFEATFHDGCGSTIKAAVFDGGIVHGTHVEFATARVSILDTGSAEHEHATHVAGTMASKGVNPKALGMAPALTLASYDWDNDLAKLDALPAEFSVTNHSYGPSAGWDWHPPYGWIWWGDTTLSTNEDAKFGKYASDNQVLDDILYRHPTLLTVVAAGNDRNDGPQAQPVSHYEYSIDPATGNLIWFISNEIRPVDHADHGGFDTIAGLGLSKNCLCVGAINDLFQDGAPIPGAAIQSTYFSSWGPSDDGRIKPDVVANGETLLSPTIAPPGALSPDAAYEEMSGTSMASPTAAGISCVVAEFFKKTKTNPPSSSEMKAILIHTATDAGPPGPDPIYGWGSINAFRAGEVISGTGEAFVQTETVANNQTKTFNLPATSGPVRVSVVWLDPPATANTGPVDDSTPTLQNDLDLTLTSPTGTVYRPYRLANTGGTWVALTDNQPNTVDNVEVIDAPASAGTWIVRVNATHLSQGTEQAFALVVSGLKKAS